MQITAFLPLARFPELSVSADARRLDYSHLLALPDLFCSNSIPELGQPDFQYPVSSWKVSKVISVSLKFCPRNYRSLTAEGW